MSEIDLPVLAALAEVAPPPAGSAGARFLRAAWRDGAAAVPETDDEVWAAWVDLRLWERSSVAGAGDLTDHARTALALLAAGLGSAARPDQEPPSPTGLTAEQDARLRTLAALTELGDLSPELQQVGRAYRARDQRAAVRPPAQVVWPDAGGTSGRS